MHVPAQISDSYPKLKEEVEKAETKEEKKSLIEDAGVILDDDELEQIAGGGAYGDGPGGRG